MSASGFKQSAKSFIKNHPFWSGAYMGLLCLIIIGSLDEFFPGIIDLYFFIWMPILGVLTGYAAKLRGRSMAWSILFGIGLIIISILPIKEHKKHRGI